MEDVYQAIQMIEENKTEEALLLLDQIKPKANDDELFVISDLYVQLGFLKEAKAILMDLSLRFPSETELKWVLSEVCIDLEEDQEALDLLAEIDPEDDYYLPSLLTAADLYQAQGLFEVAERKLLEAKRLAPHEILIDFARAELAFSTGDYQKALVHYQKVKQEKDQIADVAIDLRLAETYANVGEFEHALEHYQTVYTDDPEHLFRYGFVGFQSHRYDIAIKAWETLIDLDPEYASVYPYLADAYEEEGLIKEAYAISKKGLEFDPLNKELLLTIAALARRTGEAENSYQYAREAVAVDPGYKEAVLFLIENYREDGDEEAIIELLTHILEQGEAEGYYKWELAKAYEAEENYPKAFRYYSEAYPDFKEDADFLKAYGYFLIEEGHQKEATHVLAEYLALEPTDTEVEQYLDRLNDQLDS
ncbi:Tfp pilus assembly protein PilF [Streptohalobacillus salinus]|uniref:Tfp pilus assembly protein PilF n=1 Tax=Streptohalobacillus salinus TaxID=621096 RepID=A0A2V3WCD8_9BACI|nr:tetratricopeptide repeat protein [Streptohalobacillus salinus]PXW91732.1 Tfp pilus assembly protein PilF [Streptohalobacillus salinus]